MTETPPLAGLTQLLADDPTIVAASAGQGHTVAVPEPARAIFTATLAGATARRPVLLAVPTRAEAERIAGDLRQYLGDDAVELFPAWETLPFERVSPATETMARRLRVIWRLRVGAQEQPEHLAPFPSSYWRVKLFFDLRRQIKHAAVNCDHQRHTALPRHESSNGTDAPKCVRMDD